jgi:drug/metabolite transporter (DMT)-like permease
VLAISLAFASSILWGAADFAGGVQSRRRPIVVVLLLMQATAIGPLAVVALAAGDPAPHGSGVAWALAASAAGGLGLAAFYRGLAIGTMSIVAPVAAMGAVVPVVAGLIGGERPGALQAVGIAVALAGVITASRAPGGEGGRSATAGLGLAALAALGMGVALLGLGRASAELGVPWAVLLARAPQLVVLAVVVALVRPALPRGPRDAAPLVGLGAIDVAANVLFAAATTQGLLSLVSVVGSIYPAFTVLLARAVLAERVTRVQNIGIVATLAGVVAISAG